MNKKLILIITFVSMLILFFAAENSLAYFQPEVYRRSLLEIRDAERSLKNLEDNLKQAEDNFRIIPEAEINFQLKKLNEHYQKLLQEYRNGNDLKVQQIAENIVSMGNEVSLKTIESKPVQMRAFWLDSGTFARTGGRSGVQKLLDLAEKANFNLIFPEIFYKGITVIPDNELFTQDPRFESWEEDPLTILIEEAEKRDIEVHPWVWVFNENTSGNLGRILSEHPEWANKNKDGEIVSYHNSTWLSPAREDVKNYLQSRYKYLVENYDIQGINLDYIRFPEEYRGSFGYDQKSVEKFIEIYNIDPFTIKKGSQEFALWNKYRENLITEMVKEVSRILKAIDPDLLISADVIPGIEEARYRALQNWSLWLQKDYLDFVIPMSYTENLFWELRSWIEEDRGKINKPLYAGISVFKLTSDQVIEQLQEINQINPNGVSLFAAAHLKDSDYHSLANGIFSEPALLAHKNKKESLRAMQDFILKRLNMIQEAEKITNSNLIKIRGYLNQIISNEAGNNNDFTQFIKENNIKLSQEIKNILEADFNYLDDIITFY